MRVATFFGAVFLAVAAIGLGMFTPAGFAPSPARAQVDAGASSETDTGGDASSGTGSDATSDSGAAGSDAASDAGGAASSETGPTSGAETDSASDTATVSDPGDSGSPDSVSDTGATDSISDTGATDTGNTSETADGATDAAAEAAGADAAADADPGPDTTSSDAGPADETPATPADPAGATSTETPTTSGAATDAVADDLAAPSPATAPDIVTEAPSTGSGSFDPATGNVVVPTPTAEPVEEEAQTSGRGSGFLDRLFGGSNRGSNRGSDQDPVGADTDPDDGIAVDVEVRTVVEAPTPSPTTAAPAGSGTTPTTSGTGGGEVAGAAPGASAPRGVAEAPPAAPGTVRRAAVPALVAPAVPAPVAPAVPEVVAAPVDSRAKPQPAAARAAPRISLGSGSAPTFRVREISALGLSPRARNAARSLGFRIISERRSPLLGDRWVARLRTPGTQSAESSLAQLRGLFPEVIFDLTHLYRPSQGAPVPVSYGPDLVGFGLGSGCTISTPIGLIDTGLVGHASLSNARIAQRTFIDEDAQTNAVHGTAIASILVGALPGVVALAPGAQLYSANVFGGDAGAVRSDATAIIAALDWMAAQGVPVVNMSLMGPANQLLEAAVLAAAQRGQILLAAAGNDGPGAAPAYPAAYDAVIAVAAVDARGRPYENNNRGGYIEVAAPGVDIWGADARGGEAFWTGTSFAVPFATAAIAQGVHSGGVRNVNDARALLARSARDLGAPGRDPIYGHGLLQVASCG